MSFVLPPILHLQLVTLPAIRLADQSGHSDRTKSSINSGRDVTWRNDNDYDTFGDSRVDFNGYQSEVGRSHYTHIPDQDVAEIGFVDSFDSFNDSNVNRDDNDTPGFADDEDTPLVPPQKLSQLYQSQTTNEARRPPLNQKPTTVFSSTSSTYNSDTVVINSSNIKTTDNDSYSTVMIRPWLEPHSQRVLDWVLIIAGMFMCIFGTTVTFIQIMHQFNNSHTC